MEFTNQLCNSICLALILMLGILSSEATSHNLQDASMYGRYKQWMAHYGCVYNDTNEKEDRFQIFKDNVIYIESSNKVGNKLYKLSVNQFADRTNEEFTASRKQFKGHECSTKTSAFRYENASLPARVDWRQKGAVTPIKDQGQCELVDCDINGEDQGCEGRLMDNAFEFINQNHGLSTEANYPYTGVDGTCNAPKEASHAASIIGHEDVPANSESALLKAVVSQPVSVAIDASGSDFQFYASGVFTGTYGTSLDHGITGVGYGVNNDGIKYWLMKNLWGEQWGEEGYIRMQRDVSAPEVCVELLWKLPIPLHNLPLS